LTAIRRQGDDIAARAGAGKRRGLALRVAIAGLARLAIGREINDNFMNNFDELQAR
jgi:hypothetical protein